MPYRRAVPLALLLAALLAQPPRAQSPKPAEAANSDLELVERLLVARREYQKTLELLRAHYFKAGDLKRAKWAEEELILYHRLPKQAYRLDLDVPPPTLSAKTNIPEANKLYTRAVQYKDKGWGTDYIDNQRRAELLFQQLLTLYPQSDKISDTAYMLGDVYESKAYKQYERAAEYFERCVQWNPTTQFDARLRAARIHDRHLQNRGDAIRLYREITTHETDPKRIAEATKRLADLSGGR